MRWRLSGTGWELAAGLQVLARQVDEVWPIRHAADGTLGNVSHSDRTSDHNPDENGIVRAIDIGEVVEDDAMIVAEALRQSKDRRINYVIHEKLMYSYYWKNGYRPFTWRPYFGVNLHWNHVHISSRNSYDTDTQPWDIGKGGELDMLTPEEIDAIAKAVWDRKLGTTDEHISTLTALSRIYRSQGGHKVFLDLDDDELAKIADAVNDEQHRRSAS